MRDEIVVTPDVHRQLGRDLFNKAWDLIDRNDRNATDDNEMLLTAAASRWHWGQVGSAEQVATGDWQVAHVASLMGDGPLALRFARGALDAAEKQGWDGWRLASAHEGVARAYATNGDAAKASEHVAAARAALEREPSAEDRQLVADQLATVLVPPA